MLHACVWLVCTWQVEVRRKSGDFMIMIVDCFENLLRDGRREVLARYL